LKSIIPLSLSQLFGNTVYITVSIIQASLFIINFDNCYNNWLTILKININTKN